jgi:hypothetical protein
MSYRLPRGTRVKVTNGVDEGNRGTVVGTLPDGTHRVWLDDEGDSYLFNRNELDVHTPPLSRRIIDRDELMDLKYTLGVGHDWHEPDEQGVTVEVHGKSFDNAGFWDDDHAGRGSDGKDIEELHVVIFQNGDQVATVNLATLFAWATGYDQ